jgi:hypothetical protein
MDRCIGFCKRYEAVDGSQLQNCQGLREGGGGQGGAICPRFWGPLEIFCWVPVLFLGEIFPCIGQDICFFGAKYRNLV